MQYFARLLNSHLQSMAIKLRQLYGNETEDGLKAQLADAQVQIYELQQKIAQPAPVSIDENKVIRILNKQIDNLQEHIIALNQKIAQVYQDKAPAIQEIAAPLPTEPVVEDLWEEMLPEEAKVIPFKKTPENNNKSCRVSINFK